MHKNTLHSIHILGRVQSQCLPNFCPYFFRFEMTELLLLCAAVDDDQLIVSSHDGIHESCIYSFKLETVSISVILCCAPA